MRGPYWQFVSPNGCTERYCRQCTAHVQPLPDGSVRRPDRCPDAGPESRPFPPAGWRLLP